MLLFLFCLPGSSVAQRAAQNKEETEPLQNALRKIESDHRVFLLYESRVVEGKLVSRRRPHVADPEKALRTLLLSFRLECIQIGASTYLIRELATPGFPAMRTDAASAKPAHSFSGSPSAVTSTLSSSVTIATGRVISALDGKPLAGVSVVTRGSRRGATTTLDGAFSLPIAENGTVLQFSSVGFETQEQRMGDNPTLEVRLVPAVQGLPEVVVMGYSTQERREVTGSVGVVMARQIQSSPLTTPDQALQGQVAGVQVLQGSGAPGGAVYVRIRGVGSTGNNAPLYVIDGIPVFREQPLSQDWGVSDSQNPLLTLNPSDIERIDVLKDASAAAIYGARAANGVILITTRRGKPGPSTVSVDTYYGIQTRTRQIPLLNASQFAALSQEVRQELNQPPFPDYAEPSRWGGGDWLGAMLRPAPIQHVALTVSGGSQETRFALGASYFRQTGIVISSDLNRYAFRMNLDHQVSQRVRVGGNISLSRSTGRVLQTNDVFNGMILQALRALPTRPVYAPDGSYSKSNNLAVDGQGNPVGKAQVIENGLVANRLLGGVYLDYNFHSDLTFRSHFGVDMGNGYSQRYVPRYDFGTTDVNRTILNTVWNTQSLNWLSENTVTYRRAHPGRHGLTAMVGYTVQGITEAGDFLYSEGQPDNRIRLLGSGKLSYIKDQRLQLGLLSWLGRFNYDWAKKFLVTVNLRADGSSRFASGHKFGFFPAASLGWRLSEEPFMESLKFIDDLKLRTSYGLSGNQSIPDFLYLATVSNDIYTWGDTPAVGIAPNQFANENLKWETSAQWNGGLDAELAAGRVSLTADWYVKDTRDLLVQQPIPATSGFAQSPYVNLGRIRNRGWELSLTARPLIQKIKWTTSLHVAHNQNRVLALARDVGGVKNQLFTNELFSRPPVSVTQVGSPIGSFYGLVMDGIFQTTEEIRASAQNSVPGIAPGDVRFRDLDGNGRIDANDRTVIGNPNPRFMFGCNTTVSWKNFELSMALQGVQGREIFNFARVFTESLDGKTNNTTAALERWHGPGTSNSIPRATAVMGAYNAQPSSRFVEDGSYLRLRNVTLTWHLPGGWRKAVGLKEARLYVSAQNLATLTAYSGFDPEVNSNARQNDLSQGLDYISYPLARTISLGGHFLF